MNSDLARERAERRQRARDIMEDAIEAASARAPPMRDYDTFFDAMVDALRAEFSATYYSFREGGNSYLRKPVGRRLRSIQVSYFALGANTVLRFDPATGEIFHGKRPVIVCTANACNYERLRRLVGMGDEP